MNIRILIALILVNLISPNIGYTADTSFCQQTVHVFFGNGVWNDAEDRAKSQAVLIQRFEERIQGTSLEGKVKYALAVNPSEGKLLDLLEAYEQNTQTDLSQFWRFLSGLDSIPAYFRSKLTDIANEVDAEILRDNPAVQDHIAAYNAILGEGNKVVVVAHSQGNLFANIAYLGIRYEYMPGFGIVSVANPDSYVADGGPYTTIQEDHVIGAVPFALPANTDNFFGYVYWNDTTGHLFIDSYMRKRYASEIKILNDIQNRIDALHYVNDGLGSGMISATLKWHDSTDLDLHAYEPSGTHVYYRNMSGTSGYLDRDDTDGYGPEHYFVSCNTIETGTYLFGVNYYSGAVTDVGYMTLQAGDQLFTRMETFRYPEGSGGDTNPTIMFQLEVSGSQENGYEFFIQ